MAISKEKFQEAKNKALAFYSKCGIVLTDKEKDELEVADFGLSRLDEVGVELVMYVNTERCSAKDVVIFPGQICPEHYHPDIEGNAGKEETFRCKFGEMYLYVEGEPTENPRAVVPEDMKDHFTVWHEVIMKPGDQFLVRPNRKHWFQAGPEGAIFAEFSTKNIDEKDVFTDPNIKRIPDIMD